jgi:hypothetical protein
MHYSQLTDAPGLPFLRETVALKAELAGGAARAIGAGEANQMVDFIRCGDCFTTATAHVLCVFLFTLVATHMAE